VADRDDFERRLQEARARQGLDAAPKGRGSLPGGPWGIGFRVGVEMLSALIVGLVIGWMLDRWLGTKPWLLLLFVVLGVAAGVMNVVRVFMPRRGPRH
jgi:ATP synthase protein I